jgi:hypothetical protein
MDGLCVLCRYSAENIDNRLWATLLTKTDPHNVGHVGFGSFAGNPRFTFTHYGSALSKGAWLQAA